MASDTYPPRFPYSSADQWASEAGPSSDQTDPQPLPPSTTAPLMAYRSADDLGSQVPGRSEPGGYESRPVYDHRSSSDDEERISKGHRRDGSGEDAGVATEDDPSRGEKTRAFGRRWQWTPLHRWQAGFLLAILVQTVVVIVLVAVVFAKVAAQIIDANTRLRSIRTYLAVFIVANIFAILMALDALAYKNTMQLIALVVFDLLMMVYGAVLPGQVRKTLAEPDGVVPGPGPTNCSSDLYGQVQGLIIAIPVITGVCACCMAACTRRLYAENGWEVFKAIGADIGLRRVYSQWQVFSVLNKFNFFFYLAFSIQLLILVSGLSTGEEVVTIVAEPLILMIIILVAIGVRREIPALMVLFFAVWLGALVYYFYKLVRILSHDYHYAAAERSLTLFAFLSIFTLLATGVLAAMCWASFGKGLKDQEVHSVLDYCLRDRKGDDPEKKSARMSLD